MNENQKAIKSSESPDPIIPSEVSDKSLVANALAGQEPETKGEQVLRQLVKDDQGTPNETTSSFASDVHGYLNEYIRFADQKAAFIFTAVATMLAFLHGKGITKLWLKDPRAWSFADALAFVAIFGLVVGAITAVIVVLPRRKGSPTGFIFWRSIARFHSAKEYADQVLAAQAADLTNAKLLHSYELAAICKQKFCAVNWAVWSGGVGLLASVVHLALF